MGRYTKEGAMVKQPHTNLFTEILAINQNTDHNIEVLSYPVLTSISDGSEPQYPPRFPTKWDKNT